jgi:hypothetical protein
MIEVSIEVGNGAARFGVAVRAESSRRAVETVKTRYPDADVRVVYPIDPEAFFVREPAASACSFEFEMPESVAG